MAAAAGIFLKTAMQLVYINTALMLAAMLLFSRGQLSPPPQASPPGPAPATTTCVAPPPSLNDRVVALLLHFFAVAMLASLHLVSHVRRVVAAAATAKDGGGGLQAMDAGGKLKIRSCMMVAVVFSAVAAGVAVWISNYVLQMKYMMVFSCGMPQGLRLAVFCADAAVGVVCAYTYGHMVSATLFSV